MSQPGELPQAPLAYIVDDEPMLLDLNEAVLRSIGFDVRRFRAAETAFECYRTAATPPAIIITDFAMHAMTGLELMERCRELHPDQKFLLVSGTVDASEFRNAKQKPDQFIAKPYSTDRLSAAVRSLVGI